MDLTTLHHGVNKLRRKKRVGRGVGSGRGKTSTRGHKGQYSSAGAKKPPKIDAGSASAPPPDDPPDPPPADDPDDANPELRDMIASARQALASGDAEEALSITKKIHNKFPKAQAAWSIRASSSATAARRSPSADAAEPRWPTLSGLAGPPPQRGGPARFCRSRSPSATRWGRHGRRLNDSRCPCRP